MPLPLVQNSGSSDQSFDNQHLDAGVESYGNADDLQIQHNGTNSVVTSATGNFIIDSTAAAGAIVNRLGTDTAATSFQVRGDNDTARVTVNGLGLVTCANMVYTAPATAAGIVTLGTDYSAGGVRIITAAELISGFSYRGAAGGGGALTLPGAAATAAVLLARGITAAAGLRLPPIFVEVTDANALTVTAAAAADETVVGAADVAVNNQCAIVMYMFTGAATAHAYVVKAT